MPRAWKRAVPHAIVIAIIGAGALGAFGAFGMPRPAQVAFTIMLVAAVLWITEAVPLFVTSFLILALSLVWLHPVLGGHGIDVPTSVFLAPFFSDIILLFLGGFVLAAAFSRYGLDQRAARWVIARTGGTPPRFLMGIMAITALLSMWLSNTATAAMMMTLCYPIIRRLAPGDRYRTAIALAIPFAANIGGLGTPIGSPPNAIALQYLRDLGSAPSFARWMLFGVPAAGLMLFLAWALLLRMFRGEASRVEMEATEQRVEHPVEASIVIAVAGVTILGWLTGGVHGYSTGTVALLPVIVFFGARLLTVADFRSLSWDILLLMGGGLCLGVVISQSGLADRFIARMPTEGIGLAGLLVVMTVTACVMSSVMSNTAAANLLMPIVLGLQNVALPPLLVGVAFACSMAMALPISTPPNAIAFSSGELTVRQLMRPGLILTIAGVALTCSLFLWLWKIVGLY